MAGRSLQRRTDLLRSGCTEGGLRTLPEERYVINARYELLVQGDHEVVVHYDPSRRLELDPTSRAAIQDRCEAARLAGRKVDNHPLYRLLEWRLTTQGLVLETGPVDYETYFGLDGASAFRVEALTVAAATEVDGCLVLEERSQQVALGAGKLHVKPSGHVHPPQNPWQAVLAETEEDLGVVADEVLDARLLGLVRSLTAPCVALIYSFRVALDWESLLRRRAVDAWEYERLVALPLDPDGMESWLVESYAQRATGPGHATVLLEGRARYGAAWFERVWRQLQPS